MNFSSLSIRIMPPPRQEEPTILIDDVPSHEASPEQQALAIKVLLRQYNRTSRGIINGHEQDGNLLGEVTLRAPIETLQIPGGEMLQIHLQRFDTAQEARTLWPVIKVALENDPSFMETLKVHETMGAELTIVDVDVGDTDITVEFENVADILLVEAQERALAPLVQDEGAVEAYLEHRLSDFDDKPAAEQRIRRRLDRPEGERGLELVEADFLMHHHGGTLISHDRYARQARMRLKDCEHTTTWHPPENWQEVFESGDAQYGFCSSGKAHQHPKDASARDLICAGRVSGLMFTFPRPQEIDNS